MIEAHILCCHPCDIPDLGIVGLRRGEQRWVSEVSARASKDLRKEQGKGNIRVTRKARRLNQTPKRPAPPFVAQSRPQNNVRPEKPVVEKATEIVIERTVVQEVDTDKLKEELLTDLMGGLRSVIAEEVGKMAAQNVSEPVQAPQAPAPGLDAAQLEGVLESVLRRVIPSGGMSPSKGARLPPGPHEPLFIPNQIVPKNAKAKIKVNQKASEDGTEFDDAQAALRALRGKKRGKKTDK